MSSSKKQRNRQSTAGTRKVNHGWREEEIISLITAVQKIPSLWDIGSDEYRLSNRKLGWQKVTDELNIDGVDAAEAKIKWLSLRTTFTTNLTNLRNKGDHTPYHVKWKFFGLMSFLENSHSQQPILSTTTPDFEFCESLDSSQSSGFKVKNEIIKSPTPPSIPSHLSYISDSEQTMTTIFNNPEPDKPCNTIDKDCNSIFCDYLLMELRTLPEKKARILRNKLGRVMFEYMDECPNE